MAQKEQKGKALFDRDFEHMADDDILSQIIQDVRASELFQSPYFDKFVRFYQLYRSYIADKDKAKNRSNLFIPYAFHVIETVTPKTVLAIFNTRPYVQTMPMGLDNETRTERAKKMNKLLDYQFQHKIKLVAIATDALKTASMYGTAITKQSWSFKTKKVIKRRPKKIMGVSIPGSFEDVMVESVINDDPAMTLIPLKDFLFDPAATTIDESRYCVHKYNEDLHDLKEKAKNAKDLYRNLNTIKDTQASNSGMPQNAMLSSIGVSQVHSKGVEIWEYWTDDWVVKVANQKVVIYSAPNPFFHRRKPFSKWVNTTVPNEFYGIGDIEPMESLQNELNTTRNQRIDNVSFVLNKMWKIKRGANIDTTQLVSRPAGFIEVDETEDIEELKFTDITGSGYQEESVIKQDIDRTTGVHDTERGSTPVRRETATTMNILASAGGERFRLKTILTEYGGFHDAVNQIVWLNQQYIDTDREIVLLGDDGVLTNDTITPEEIWGNYTIIAVGSSVEPTVNKEQRQTQLVQLYNIVQARPDINHQELLRSIFESFDMKNIDRLFQAQPQVPQPGMPVMGQPPMPGVQ